MDSNQDVQQYRDGAVSTSAASRECIQIFKELRAALTDSETASKAGITLTDCDDQLEKFKSWANNLGALQRTSAPSSLDQRLKLAPTISKQILQLLEDLKEAISDGVFYAFQAHATRSYLTEIAVAIALGESPNRQIIVGCAISENGSSVEGTTFESETEDLFELAKDLISSLFRISILIRDATPRDRYAKAVSDRSDPFLPVADINHVFDKFPKLRPEKMEWLQLRLGKANSLRRQYLRYFREHHIRLAGDEDEEEQTTMLQTNNATSHSGKSSAHPRVSVEDGEQSSKLQSTLFTKASTLAATKLDDTEASDDAISQASSWATSFDSNLDEDEPHVFQLAELPHLKNRFECPYCWTFQHFSDEKAWRYVILYYCKPDRNTKEHRKHVHQDLRSYVCLNEHCNMRLFGERSTWFIHDLDFHKAQWKCQ